MIDINTPHSRKAALREYASTRSEADGFTFTDVNFDPQTLTFTWRWDGPQTTQFFFQFCRPGLTEGECSIEPDDPETCGVRYYNYLPNFFFAPGRFGFILGDNNPQGIVLTQTEDGLYTLDMSSWVFENGKDSFKTLVSNLCCGLGITITYRVWGYYIESPFFAQSSFRNLVECTPECCASNALEIVENAQAIGELETAVAVQETRLDTLRTDVDGQGSQIKDQSADIDALQSDADALQETQQKQQEQIDGHGRILSRQGAQLRELDAQQKVQADRIAAVNATVRSNSGRIMATQITVLAGAVAALVLRGVTLSGRG